MSKFTAIYDACVLYPMPLCDLLMQLAMTDTYHAKWSDSIHEEWMQTTRKTRPDIAEDKIQRKREFMDKKVRDTLVKNYKPLIPSLELPDPDDRHVLAAAIRSNANVIVTFNLKDFPDDKLKPWGIEAQHPDAVCWAVKTVRARLNNPTMSVDAYLATLEKQRLTKTVAALSDYAGII